MFLKKIIAELDKRLEELPEVREGLVEKCRVEKVQMKIISAKDYVEERETENSTMFDIIAQRKFDKLIDETNMENEQKPFYRRR